MAITLKVEDYCQNCPEFEADVDKTKEIAFTHISFNEEVMISTTTTITCVHRDRCAELRKHIERNIKKK